MSWHNEFEGFTDKWSPLRRQKAQNSRSIVKCSAKFEKMTDFSESFCPFIREKSTH